MKLTVPNDPVLLSSERSKLYEEIVSTETKILNEIQNRGPFKARPLNKKMFEPRTSDSTNEKKSVTRLEPTKFKEFKLSMTKQNSDSFETLANMKQFFKAIPLPKTTYTTHCMERKSAPPKITQPIGFNLNTDRRGAIDRRKLPIETEAKVVFKSRPMPSFPSPGSP